jgi:thiol-disulfide isomerase/thioredoxin
MVLRSLLSCMFVALIVSIVTLSVQGQGAKQDKPAEKQEPEVVSPKVIAVEFYADWCASCKVLMPKIDELRKDFKNRPVLFVRFDMTNDFTKQQASQMAAFAGLQDVYRRGGGKTGMVALVDAKTKNVIVIFGQKKTTDEIQILFDEAITKASSSAGG